jgi:hypothetical protein
MRGDPSVREGSRFGNGMVDISRLVGLFLAGDHVCDTSDHVGKGGGGRHVRGKGNVFFSLPLQSTVQRLKQVDHVIEKKNRVKKKRREKLCSSQLAFHRENERTAFCALTGRVSSRRFR